MRLAWLTLALGAGIAQGNPTGPSIVNGQVVFSYQGNLLYITNTPGSIINWQKFSIGSNELVRFLQQSAGSSVLNRVVGVDPSQIFGALQSNGRVFLINPNGIVFGAGAQINVAGLVASTLNLSDADFLAGRMRFTETPGAGSVVNNGAITTPVDGNVYLIASDILNSGVITSPQGEIILAAGKSVELVSPGTPNLRVELTAPNNSVVNVGQIMADSGRVGIYAGLIRNTGTIRADGVVVGQNGEILLRARTMDIQGTVSAGSIRIDPDDIQIGTGGVVLQTPGVLTVNTGNTLTLNGGNSSGNVTLTGGNVTLTPSAGFLRAFVTKAAQSAQMIVANGGQVGSTVISGLASLSQLGTVLTTTNTPGSIMNWQQFSIGAGDVTHIIQPGSTLVLNRVSAADPSAILGAVQSNGQITVTVVSSGGIVINGSGTVQAAGVIQSSGTNITVP